MRIAHLVIGGEVAGGQLVALALAQGARAAGHECRFVSPSPGPFLERARDAGFETHVIPIGGALSVPSIVRLRRAFATADLVHTHGHFAVNVLGRLAGRLAGARVVSHMHLENTFRSGRGRRAQILLDNLTARLCAWIVAVSEATRRSLLAQGYPAARTVTVRNGIDRERVEPRRPEGIPPGAPLVGEVARLCAVKGQRELIQAVAQLDGVWLALAGEDLEQGGAFRRGLETETEALGIADRVRFLGYQRDVDALLAALDVFVLPSHVEGLPMTVLEAMAQGTPVVATDVGGTAEAVGPESGILVPPRDVEALARALGDLLADPERARALGEAGRERVATELSERAMTVRVLELYVEALA